MKKILGLGGLFLLFFCSIMIVFASSFEFSITNFSLTNQEHQAVILNEFKEEYRLSYKLENTKFDREEEIRNLTKKTTYLLLGKMNQESETSEEFFLRKKEYFENALYNYFPKDSTTESGYDETIPSYIYAIAGELAIPQLFTQFNEIDVDYNSYGDIRIMSDGDITVSSITLEDVFVNTESQDNPQEYTQQKTNLTIYYYFVSVENKYYLGYLFGEMSDEIINYLDEIETSETQNRLLTTSYTSYLSNLYDFQKLNELPESTTTEIYEKNKQNVVYLSSFYNNQITGNANGFFITNSLVVTNWSFLETALQTSQFISMIDANGQNRKIEGIVTINIDADIAVLKCQEESFTSGILNSSFPEIEDPVFLLSSKSGVSFTIQRGIVLNNNEMLETSIPVSKEDAGGVLLNKDGKIVGYISGKNTNRSISLAYPFEALQEVKEKFQSIPHESIEAIAFDTLKEKYYKKQQEESIKNNIPEKKWNTYSQIGNIKESISLPLVKGSYQNKVLSLRYKNDINSMIDSMDFAQEFIANLKKDGYEEVEKNETKCVYKNKQYQIMITEEFQYLVIVMVEL